MGQISGVNAELIRSIAGVAVANISYVGPTSAATLGLGGGGGGVKVFSSEPFEQGLRACNDGPLSIIKGNTQTLYKNGETFYYDAEFTYPFDGGGNWWYDGTDNISYQIGNEGNFFNIFNCGGGDSLKTFANFIWENTESICFQGPEIIIEVGTITLYYNQGENRMYNNEIFTEPFSGTGLYYYNQTDNQWWQISGEGYVGATGTCS